MPPDPCRCGVIDLKQTLAPLNGPNPPFLPAYRTGKAQIFTLFSQNTDSAACGLADGTSKCERASFKFIDSKTLKEITTFPYKGVAWDGIKYQLTLQPQSDDPLGLHKVLVIAYLPSNKDVLESVEV